MAIATRTVPVIAVAKGCREVLHLRCRGALAQFFCVLPLYKAKTKPESVYSTVRLCRRSYLSYSNACRACRSLLRYSTRFQQRGVCFTTNLRGTSGNSKSSLNIGLFSLFYPTKNKYSKILVKELAISFDKSCITYITCITA